ncbi:hypothetical protein EYR41_008703 [Orbilia oligospora]|uniref:Uncharacterized protein n=1 Tax=Orbilia oligospora TaxID=2813651 RepID=A0A8H2HS06_ORBOL|nr:hypothetical protein EYR41_008703 [Orbilia oligospora]
MESTSTKELDFNIKEQRYLTSCSILTSLSTRHSDCARNDQLRQIRNEKEDMGRAYLLDMLLDRLACLLVAHGRGDCVAGALGGLTNNKITLLASYATSGSEEAAQKSGRAQPWTLEATVNLRAEKTRSTEEIKLHGERIFGYLSSYHSTTDQQVRRDIDKDFSIQQMLYSIDKIQSRYRILNGHLRKIRRVDLREYEHKAIEQWEKDYYIPMPNRGNSQDESLAERGCAEILDAFFQLVLKVEGSCIFSRWAAILQKIVDGQGEKRAGRDNTGLLNIFPDAPKEHAGLILLEHMVQQNTRPTYGYIGISKRPCFVCENVLRPHKRLYKPNIRTRKGQGHVYVSEIPKGLGVDNIERVFDVVDELAQKVTIEASPAKIKPKSADTTYSHHIQGLLTETDEPLHLVNNETIRKKYEHLDKEQEGEGQA